MMIFDGCISCWQAINQQKRDDEKTIQLARDEAKRTGKPVGLYRDELGRLCIARNGEPVIHIVNP